MELRPYQRESVDAIFRFFRENPTGHPLVALPPAAGKSHVIAQFIREALIQYPQTRFLNIVHVKELIAQSHAKLVHLWNSAPAGIYSSGLKRRDTHFPILFTGIASIAKRVSELGKFDLVLIDEADMVSHKEETMYRNVIFELQQANPMVRFIGFTGTPFRHGLGALTDGGVFTHVVVDYCSFEKFNELVDKGFLCPLIPKRTDTLVDISSVHIRGGEFVQNELQEAVDKDNITRAAIKETIAVAQDRQHWLVFATGIKHADNICAVLNEYGIHAACVHSGNPQDRDKNIWMFRNGQLRAMVGVGVFGVGFDCPEVDCIVMLRPTASARIWIQFLGRGLRIHPSKKDTLVLDFAKNTVRLGCINDVVIPKKPGEKKSGMVPFRVCEKCGTYAHTRTAICPCCQYEFPIMPKIVKKASEEELIRRTPKEPKPPKPPKAELPAIINTYEVERVEFSKHNSRDGTKPPSLKVHYHCGIRIVNEFLCLQHNGFASHKAREKWRQMAGYEDAPPATVDEALMKVDLLHLPSKIRVMEGGKYDEVCGYEFSTTKQPVLDPF